MKWPWSNRKKKRIEQTRQAHKEAQYRQEHQVAPLARKLSRLEREDPFASRFRNALGGGA